MIRRLRDILRGGGCLTTAVVCIAAVLFALAPSARAETVEFVFRGAGWGHGIGLGQWGSKGAADAGRSSGDILRHFYSNSVLASRSMPGGIRLGLHQNVSSFTVSGNGRVDFVEGGKPQPVASAGANESWTVSPTSNGAFRIRAPGGQEWTAGGPATWLEVRYAEHGTIAKVGSTRYNRGWIELNTTGSSGAYRLRSIIHVSPFEAYLYGLGEVPSSWPTAALEAQAVAARTYAVEKMGRLGVRQACNCHLYADTRDQAYVGYEKEAGGGFSRWKAAVDGTAGTVVLHDNKPIQAFYSSSSGGHTEHNENVWGGNPIAYLRGVPDAWDSDVSPHASWTVRFEGDELSQKLASRSSTNVGTVRTVDLLAPRGVSGRVTRVIDDNRGGVRLTGSNGTKRVSGDTLRSVLGLRSTLFNLDVTGLAHPDGTLLKGSGARIYELRAGTRWPVASGATYRSRFAWQETVKVTDDTLRSYPTARLRFRDGELLRTPDGAIWAVSNGERRHIASMAVFNGLGYSTGAVRNVSNAEAAMHPEGPKLTSSATHPDGTVLKGSTAHVYLIDRGAKRHVPSPAVYRSRFHSAHIVRTSQSRVDAYPDGEGVGFRDGSIVKDGDGAIWVISNGARRHITSMATFRALGFQRAQVLSGSVGRHPVGEPVRDGSVHPDGTLLSGSTSQIWVLRDGTRLGIATPGPLVSHYRSEDIVEVSDGALDRYPTARVRFRDGALLKTPDGAIWVISNGLRRRIGSMSTFEALGYSSAAVRDVSHADAGLHLEGPSVTDTSVHPDGTVIRSPDAETYLVELGRKRHLRSAQIVASRVSSEEVVDVDATELARYPDGPEIGFRDGSLIKTPSGAIWAIANTLRRHITSMRAFTGLNYDGDNVREASDAEASVHDRGRPIP